MADIDNNYMLKCKELEMLLEEDQKNLESLTLELKNEEQASTINEPTATNGNNSSQIFIAGFNNRVDEQKMREYFSRWGNISDIFFPCYENVNKPRYFCYLTFSQVYNKHPCDENEPHIIEGCLLHIDRNEFSSTSNIKTSVIMVNGPIQTLSSSTLQDYFTNFGKIKHIHRKKNVFKKNEYHRYAFIQFTNTETVDKIVQIFHHKIDNTLVHVRKARDFDDGEDEMVFVHQAKAAQKPLNTSTVMLLENYSLAKYRVLPMDDVVTLDVLKTYFQQYGHVVDSYVPHEYGKNETKSYGYIILATKKDSFIHGRLNGRHLMDDIEFRIELDVPSKYNVTTDCIIVSASPNVLCRISENQLKNYFKKFGKIVDVRKPIDAKLKIKTHYAFVQLASTSAVDQVVKQAVHVINNLPFSVAKARNEPR